MGCAGTARQPGARTWRRRRALRSRPRHEVRRDGRRLHHGEGSWWWRTAEGRCGGTTSATTPGRPRRCWSSSGAWRRRRSSSPAATACSSPAPARASSAPLVGAKMVQEVVAVAACVEQQHPDVRFVSEIGGEDMKTIFFTPGGGGKTKQVYMQSACSGGTGTFIEKTARKLQVASERLAEMSYEGMSLHKVSSKCGIFAETDANSLVKTGVPVEEIIASLFEAVVYQNLATLTKGNTPSPEVLLLGGPNLFFRGLQEAWRHHLAKLWEQRKIAVPDGPRPRRLHRGAEGGALLRVPRLRGDRPGRAGGRGVYAGAGQAPLVGGGGPSTSRRPRTAARALVACAADLEGFMKAYDVKRADTRRAGGAPRPSTPGPVLVGCDFGSTTAKAVVRLPRRASMLFSCYALSRATPSRMRRRCFRQVREAGFTEVAGLALTGYGKDLLKDVLGADVAVVETVAHATGDAALLPGRGRHLRRGRHRRQDHDPSPGHGGRLPARTRSARPGTAPSCRAWPSGTTMPLAAYADRAFAGEGHADASPWAAACSSSPTSSTSSARAGRRRRSWPRWPRCCPSTCGCTRASCRTCARSGRKFVLQGGTHRNMAVVKAQVDFIRGKVPDAEVVLHPYSGRGRRHRGRAVRRGLRPARGRPSRFRGFDAIAALDLHQHDRARRPSASGARSTARARSSTSSSPARTAARGASCRWRRAGSA